MAPKLKWPWAGDRTWTNGAWRATEAMAARAGADALLAEPIKEPKGNHRIWAVLGVVITLPYALWTLTAIISRPREAGLQLLVLLAILGWSLRSVVKVHTRRVQFDEAGLSDADFFGVRRVPWGEIRNMVLVNLNADAQARYARTRMKDREGPRPKDDMGAWDVGGEGGVVLLRLHKGMVPQDALTALRERIQQQIREGTRDVFGFAKEGPAPSVAAQADGEGRRVLDPDDPRAQELIQEHGMAVRKFELDRSKLEERLNKPFQRIVQGALALFLLPLLLGTAYLGYQSLWFRFAAAEAQGWVVSIHPTLVVEYPISAERIVRWGAPHAGDPDLAVGARVRVFYDPADPERMRLDLFEEMWATTLLVGGLTLFAGLLAALMVWTVRPAKARSKLPRG